MHEFKWTLFIGPCCISVTHLINSTVKLLIPNKSLIEIWDSWKPCGQVSVTNPTAEYSSSNEVSYAKEPLRNPFLLPVVFPFAHRKTHLSSTSEFSYVSRSHDLTNSVSSIHPCTWMILWDSHGLLVLVWDFSGFFPPSKIFWKMNGYTKFPLQYVWIRAWVCIVPCNELASHQKWECFPGIWSKSVTTQFRKMEWTTLVFWVPHISTLLYIRNKFHRTKLKKCGFRYWFEIIYVFKRALATILTPGCAVLYSAMSV